MCIFFHYHVVWSIAALFNFISLYFLFIFAVSSPCEDGAHDCSHVCLATSDATYRCSCPTYGNLVLQTDNKTCAGELFVLLLPPAKRSLGQVNVFTSVCHSVHSEVWHTPLPPPPGNHPPDRAPFEIATEAGCY